MSMLSKKSFILDEEEDNNIEEYRLPSIVTSKPEVIPIKKSFAISTALHPAVVLLIWLITVALALMGINLSLFKRPDAQLKKDIEFVLVDKEAQPRDPNTKNRSDMNSRSGGINDPKRKVSMPSPAPKKSSKPSAAAKSANKIIKQQQQQIKKQVVQQQKAQQQAPKKTTQAPAQKPSPAKSAPPTARPSARPTSAPTPVAKPSSSFTAPVPKSAPPGKTLSTGPIGGTSVPTGSKTGSSGSSKGSAYAPRPSLSPSAGGGSNSPLARGSSGSGNIGNPGGGGGAPGIDALREPDFGPYMRELQRRIKLNWDPPKGNESKRVILLFKIAKDGRLLSCRVHKSSGLPSADQAALKAVELTAPFRPLPADFKGQSIDIQFTFDYNVFGAKY